MAPEISTEILADLQARARSIRRGIITSTTAAGSGHPTSSLSGVEIAVALYFGGFLRHDPKEPHWPQRDRLVCPLYRMRGYAGGKGLRLALLDHQQCERE